MIFRRFSGHLRARVAAGVLFVIPVGLTYLVLRFLWDFFFGLLSPLFNLADGREDATAVGFLLRLSVVLIILVLLYIVGWFAPTVIGRQFVKLWTGIINQIPIVRSIYRVSRLFTQMFTGPTQAEGNRVVLLEYPRQGVLGLGLVTSRYHNPEDEDLLTVYIPTIPNPTSGFLAVVKEDQVIDTDLTFDDAMQIVISGGLLTEEITRNRGVKRKAPVP